MSLSGFVTLLFCVAFILPWVLFAWLAATTRADAVAQTQMTLGAVAKAYAEHHAALARAGVDAAQDAAAFRGALELPGVTLSLRASASPNATSDTDRAITVEASVPGAGVIALATIPTEVALHTWRQRTRVQAAAVMLRSLFVIMVGVFLVHQIRAKERLQAELVRAREAAELASRAKSDLLANTSHELRTPLNAIIGFSDIIKRGMFGPVSVKYRDYAGDIYNSGTHLLSVINDILDLSKLEAGQLALEDENVDLCVAVRDCLRLVEAQAGKAQVTLGATLPDDCPLLRADDRRLRQIVINLLSNAVKFTPEGGRVHVTVAADGLSLEVSDTGIGMRPDQIAKALEPFGQIDSKRNRKYQGTGLGLPISRHLAELHGGTLAIRSEENAGTTVAISLPAERILSQPMRSAAIAVA